MADRLSGRAEQLGWPVTECRVCDAKDLEPVIDLGLQPWCNHFLKKEEVGREPKFPLRVVYCLNCATAQLDYTVRKEVMFSDHTYLSGITRSLSEHFRQVAADVDGRFLKDVAEKSVLDIGSNDGTQLKHFKALGYDVLGVESSRTAVERATQSGIPTLHRFFDLATIRELGRRFDVINAAGVFFHLEELHSVAEAIREGLKERGVFVVQFLYMKRIVENSAFDQIYHEHLLYYNLATLDILLNRHGLALFDAYLAPIHGGSIVGFAGHRGVWHPSPRLLELRAREDREGSNAIETYRAFATRIDGLKELNLRLLERARAERKRVFGLGAPAKGNTLLNYFGIGTQYLECLVERNELRRGLYSPGMHIPIVWEGDLRQPPDIYYVLAWNFKQEILERYAEAVGQGVQFYFPIDPGDP
ncbi:MAG TPA: class I SAM-dependent methyltransferase [Gemmatimonadaceae bacterium]|nr:class I SAM-dependent methyltransferase [Gemmatimonadaceae bacterium]